ncbi:MAG: hypothetical protein GF344_09170 [Chitinivibrionales bacterium]|nr:hypothetical protein [Chitinivibrionales bacterium]MBD3357020.1 hypothetical protein [Chitinivibrionales bacterium]
MQFGGILCTCEYAKKQNSRKELIAVTLIRRACCLLLLPFFVALCQPTETALRWEKRIKDGDTFLVGADLRGLDLHDMSMRGARLLAANFQGASLLGVDFSNADLRGAKGLTLDQLQTVRSLHGAKLDPHFEEGLKKCCSWLFEPAVDDS